MNIFQNDLSIAKSVEWDGTQWVDTPTNYIKSSWVYDIISVD